MYIHAQMCIIMLSQDLSFDMAARVMPFPSALVVSLSSMGTLSVPFSQRHTHTHTHKTKVRQANEKSSGFQKGAYRDGEETRQGWDWSTIHDLADCETLRNSLF